MVVSGDFILLAALVAWGGGVGSGLYLGQRVSLWALIALITTGLLMSAIALSALTAMSFLGLPGAAIMLVSAGLLGPALTLKVPVALVVSVVAAVGAAFFAAWLLLAGACVQGSCI